MGIAHNRQCPHPCMGCGEKDKYRKFNELCWECAKLLKEAIRVQGIKRNPKDQITVLVPECDHWIKYIPHPGSDTDPRTAIHHLALCSGTPLPAFNDAKCESLARDCSSSSCTPVLMLRDTFTAIQETIAMVRECIDAAYNEGKSDGSNLLRSLAASEISVKEFNEQSVEN